MYHKLLNQINAILLMLVGLVFVNSVYATSVTPMVSVGNTHMAAIKSDGSLWYWGAGVSKSTVTTTTSDPIQIGSEFLKVSAGYGNTLAIKSDGTLWGVGSNNLAQLGTGNTTAQALLVQIGADSNWADVSMGLNHSIAIKKNGTLWAWGFNNAGQLGLGSQTNYDGTASTLVTSPVQVGISSNWVAVATGHTHTLALKSDGTIWAWGSVSNDVNDKHGQIGNGNTNGALSPTQIGSSNTWKSISANFSSSAAIKNDGSLWAWGRNSEGQLGDGTTTDRTTPVLIGNGFSFVSVGGSTSYGVKGDGSLLGWGSNYYGNVGDGTTTDRLTPTEIGKNYTSDSVGQAQRA